MDDIPKIKEDTVGAEATRKASEAVKAMLAAKKRARATVSPKSQSSLQLISKESFRN